MAICVLNAELALVFAQWKLSTLVMNNTLLIRILALIVVYASQNALKVQSLLMMKQKKSGLS
jgi:hypothetical protein